MTTDEARREQGLSFGPAAALYDSIRPSYPPQAVAFALAPLGAGRKRVADVGAGTGIMTRLLLAAGCDVVAVEPDPRMRQRLLAATPAATAVEGSAESLPLPDSSIDGAVAAQAYHWFDPDRAHPSLARVIRPGGVFAAIWNHRDEATPWVAEYSRIVNADRPSDDPTRHHHHAVESFGPAFGAVERATFHHATTATPQSLVRLLQSRSYYLRATSTRQSELERMVLDLATSHPDLAGRAEFALPYETLVFRAVRARA